MKSDPTGYIKGLVSKTNQFINSRELPRSTDVYVYRKWSVLLTLLTWKINGFGFPFGVVLPFALIGIFSYWRRIPFPVWSFIILYPLSIILVLVTSRYRIEVIPVLLIMASAGFFNIRNLMQEKFTVKKWSGAAVILILVLLSIFSGPYTQEKTNYDAELYYCVGVEEKNKANMERAVHAFQQAIQLQPDYPEAYNNLGVIAEQSGNVEQAILYYSRAVALNPEIIVSRRNFARVLDAGGYLDMAIEQYKAALALDANQADVLARTGFLLARQNRLEEAIPYYTNSLKISPDNADVQNNCGAALYELGRIAEAIPRFEAALALNPKPGTAMENLVDAMLKQNQREN